MKKRPKLGLAYFLNVFLWVRTSLKYETPNQIATIPRIIPKTNSSTLLILNPFCCAVSLGCSPPTRKFINPIYCTKKSVKGGY